MASDGQIVIEADLDYAAFRAGCAAVVSLLTSVTGQTASLTSAAETRASSLTARYRAIGAQAGNLLAAGIRSGTANVTSAASAVSQGAASPFSNMSERMNRVGQAAMAGLTAGINSSSAQVLAALSRLSANMTATMKSALGISSPSRVMREQVGQNVGSGIAAGVLDRLPAISDAMKTAAGTVTNVSVTPTVTAPAAAVSRETVPMNNTFVFERPVETPAAHARAVRRTMEEVLYGG